MSWRGPTHRVVGGERIDGAWCHVWRRSPYHEEYFVEDLVVFADGAVHCEERTDLEGLEKLLGSGRISVRNPDAPARDADAPKWGSRSPEPCTSESFLLEVADKVEELSGRPTTRDRLQEAIGRYQEEPSEARRALLRDAYLAVPPHLRIYVLGDMDSLDRPLRILVTDLGEPVDGDGPVATAALHREALDYFRRRDESVRRAGEWRAVRHADDPEGPVEPALVSNEVGYPRGWPEKPGLFVLRNDYPVPVEFAGRTYASVLHGYWALSAADADDHDRIRAADTPHEAQMLGGRAVRRDDWPELRLAVMAGLLRAKFTQHPGLTEVLLSTGDARISYTGLSDSPYWTDARDDRGRNWVGRLLELVRSELLLASVSWPTAE
ncbi:NADAR family protein [Streptomyces sp. TRM68416]|uniref:NADAR family protein n=1 Tax=Streptomyces sp. TRM68416 TaxID=2758412 RepID=UPI001661AB17|nr:NADAR family protein [Streptomyces sp. TRM68416]MBD0838090.1 NADAR family protein [Streptomyces sp. TRM68416]